MGITNFNTQRIRFKDIDEWIEYLGKSSRARAQILTECIFAQTY